MNGLFDNLNPEIEARDRGMASAADVPDNARILDRLRDRMRRLYKIRRLTPMGGEAYVTADDARIELDAAIERGEFERPQGKLNFLGSLFKAPGWETEGGFIKSRTSGSHANRILKWRWIGD